MVGNEHISLYLQNIVEFSKLLSSFCELRKNFKKKLTSVWPGNNDIQQLNARVFFFLIRDWVSRTKGIVHVEIATIT